MYTKEKPETIREMFNHIAPAYDRANDIISFRLHRRWNRTMWESVVTGEGPVLDLCCGTGESSLPFLKQKQAAYLLDFSPEMLGVAKEKAMRLGFQSVDFLEADAQAIPLENESAGYATMAYGIRNVRDPATCLAEVYRVLTPEGRFGILELTRPGNPILRLGHRAYSSLVLPWLGRLVTSDRQAYAYLCRSIQTFIQPNDLSLLLRQAGFRDVTVRPLAGGIATLFLAEK